MALGVGAVAVGADGGADLRRHRPDRRASLRRCASAPRRHGFAPGRDRAAAWSPGGSRRSGDPAGTAGPRLRSPERFLRNPSERADGVPRLLSGVLPMMLGLLRALAVVLLAATPAWPQPWLGVLDPARAINWSTAGSSLISAVRSNCLTAQCATVSGGTVTTASLDAAITSAPANTIINIPAGAFTIAFDVSLNTGGIRFNNKSNVT